MSQNDKILKWFYYVTVVFMAFGMIVLIDDGEFDIYVAWNMIAYGVGVYLINKLK